MDEFKKYARFSPEHDIQVETRTWHEFPTDNTEDGLKETIDWYSNNKETARL